MTIAQHSGIVTKVSDGFVTVSIESQSACSSCEAHGKCGFADSVKKEVSVKTNDWQSYNEGDSVMVGINKNLGLKAVLIAYLLPAVLMIVLFFVLDKYIGDLWSAICSIVIVVVYWGALSVFGKHLQKEFSFSINKK